MENKTIRVMVAGHICLDITPGFNPLLAGGFDRIFTPGKLINVEEAVIGAGGTVSNAGLAMARLGMDVCLNGKVGDDAFGRIIKNRIGLDRSAAFRMVSGQSSSYSIVLALPGVDRVFLHHPGTNDTFVADDIDYHALSGCSLLHFGYPTLMRKMYENEGHELFRVFKKAKELGVVTSLDMTLPDPNSDSGQANWQKILKRVLPFVDIFLPSVEELAYMLDRDLFEKRKAQTNGRDPVLSYTGHDCSMLSGVLLDLGVKIVSIKLGINGYYLRTAGKVALGTLTASVGGVNGWADRELWAGSYRADEFGSANGAGDATIAGFLTAFLRGLGPIQCVKAANVLGWQNVRQVDTLSGIEDWPKTLEMINDDCMSRNSLTVNDMGWQYCADKLVYYGPYDKHNK